jgi:hypothetical protein
MSTIAVAAADLDDRIALAFGNDVKSDEVADLIVEAEAASVSYGESAKQARARALDPVLSAKGVDEARRQMGNSAFKHERLQTAVTRLQERLKELRAQEEDDRRRATYEKVKAERDRLAAELADTYPAIERQLVDLFARLDANDREVKYLNAHLPTSTGRLLVAELVARGLDGFVKNATQISRMTEQLCLPAFECSVHHPLAWPR